MTLYPKLILEALSQVHYPGEKEDIVKSGMVADDIRIDGRKVSFTIVSNRRNSPFMKSLLKAAVSSIKLYAGEDCEVEISVEKPRASDSVVVDKKSPISAKKIIAISSGKGGVGKSTVASNLAVSLASKGFKVGLLDADVFGPSAPKMFDIEEYRPEAYDDGERTLIVPAEKYGVKVMSIGFFVDANGAVVWRGAMASNAIKQLVEEVKWGELDYFLVDLPPGTSDIHLTMVNVLKFSGAIIVSTPQDVALADVVRGIDMFENEKIEVPIIGLIENMAYFTPAELPENKYYIFGKNGVKNLAEQRGIQLLAQIPIVESVCRNGDMGKPSVLENAIISGIYDEIVAKLESMPL